MAERPEKKFEAKLVKALRMLGCVVWKTHGGNASAGWPDLMIVSGAITGWIEVKALEPKAVTKDKVLAMMSARQAKRCQELDRAGVNVWVCAGTAGQRASGLEEAVNCQGVLVRVGSPGTLASKPGWHLTTGLAVYVVESLRLQAKAPNLSLVDPRSPSRAPGW